jgi:CRP-like cAMP-binding protein
MKKDARVELLRNVWLFERCSKKELALLATNSTPVTVEAGTVLAHEGDIGREFFVIISGRAEVTKSAAHLGTLGIGDFFGEMSLLDRCPRSATITTIVESELLVLTAPAFTNVVDSMPSVDRKMLTVLVERLRDVEERYVPAAERRLSDAV